MMQDNNIGVNSDYKSLFIHQVSGEKNLFISCLHKNYISYQNIEAFNTFSIIFEDHDVILEVRARALLIMFIFFPLRGLEKRNLVFYLNKLYNEKYRYPDNPYMIKEIYCDNIDLFEHQNLELIEYIKENARAIIEENQFELSIRSSAAAMILLLISKTAITPDVKKYLKQLVVSGLVQSFNPYYRLSDQHIGYLASWVLYLKKN